MASGYIEKLANGRYEVGVPVQDGTDRFICYTEAEAIESYRQGMVWAGGPRSKPEDVRIPEIIDRSKPPIIVVDAFGHYDVPTEQLACAVVQAMKGSEFGRRYELRLSIMPVAGDPTYVGSGI